MRHRAEYSPPARGDRARVIRVEVCSSDLAKRGRRLTLPEAKELLRQLSAAVFLAEAAEQRGDTPEEGGA